MNSSVISVTKKTANGKRRFTALTAIVSVEIRSVMRATSSQEFTKPGKRKVKKNLPGVSSTTSVRTVASYWTV